jgi:hypothetical protein
MHKMNIINSILERFDLTSLRKSRLDALNRERKALEALIFELIQPRKYNQNSTGCVIFSMDLSSKHSKSKFVNREFILTSNKVHKFTKN